MVDDAVKGGRWIRGLRFEVLVPDLFCVESV